MFLVDDDEDDRFLMREAIVQVDQYVKIIEALDGLDLVNKLGKYEPESISLVLLDMNMPKMNGIETIRHVKGMQGFEPVPMVMISTSNHNTIKEKALLAGGAKFLLKPNSFDDFIVLMRELKDQFFH